MEIKVASTPQSSQSLKGIKISNRVQIGLIILSAIGWVAYNEVPANIQAKVGRYALMGITAGAFTSKLLNDSVRENRLEIGDLRETVTNYALLNSPEAATRLQSIANFIDSGEIPTGEEIRMNVEKLTGDLTK